jgi:hypothetical protein
VVIAVIQTTKVLNVTVIPREILLKKSGNVMVTAANQTDSFKVTVTMIFELCI